MVNAGVRVGGVFRIKCFDKHGNLKWIDEAKNLVPDAAINDLISVWLAGGTQDTTWFIGLKEAGTPAAADTLASHASWSENSDYSGDRKAWTLGSVSAKSVSNSASPASFTFTADSLTIAGCFICSVATGTTGLLVCAADFSAARSGIMTNDVLEVTYTFTGASS